MKRILMPERRSQVLNDAVTALNLSFVLHEHSASDSVRSAIRAIETHARSLETRGAGRVPAVVLTWRARTDNGRYPTGTSGFRRRAQLNEGGEHQWTRLAGSDAGVPTAIDYWLTATVGLPDRLADALSVDPKTIVRVDAVTVAQRTHQFFRAPAQLALPDWPETTVGVAALILRPDRRSHHLIVHGPYAWPVDRMSALRAVEQIIQSHVGQWMPPRPLWPAPAEVLLPDEIYLGSDDASRMS